MRILPLPERRDPAQQAWLDQLDAALSDQDPAPAAGPWRKLRDDVRALAPAPNADFEHRLEAELAAWTSSTGWTTGSTAESTAGSAARAAGSTAGPTGAAPPKRRRLLGGMGSRRPFGGIGSRHLFDRMGLSALPTHTGPAALATALVAVAAGLVIVAPWQSPSKSPSPVVSSSSAQGLGSSAGAAQPASPARAPSPSRSLESRASAGPPQASPEAAGSSAGDATTEGIAPSGSAGKSVPLSQAAAAAGRKQHRAASLTLSATPGHVQAVADRAARLAVSEKGFVASSHVDTHSRRSEAFLLLTLPAAHFSAALASLQRLAPVRAESQSLQDITGAYTTARRRLSDARAERRALLRALAAATTEGEIDSLRERLSANSRSLSRAATALNAISTRADTAQVTITIIGTPSSDSGSTEGSHSGNGPTLKGGLHDALKVLTVVVIVLLVAAAILLPLALLLALLAGAHAGWRRRQRERALD